MRGLLATFALAILPAACEDPLSPNELRLVERGELLWAARGYTDYSFETRLDCFCPPSLRDWARVTVIDGKVVDVLLLTTLGGVTGERLQWWRTIDQLFGDLRHAGENQDWLEDLQFTLDGSLGYPTLIYWISKSTVADAGSIQYLRNVRPFPPGFSPD